MLRHVVTAAPRLTRRTWILDTSRCLASHATAIPVVARPGMGSRQPRTAYPMISSSSSSHCFFQPSWSGQCFFSSEISTTGTNDNEEEHVDNNSILDLKEAKTPMSKKARKKYRKQEPKTPTTPDDRENFFDTIAPHLSLGALHRIIKFMNKTKQPKKSKRRTKTPNTGDSTILEENTEATTTSTTTDMESPGTLLSNVHSQFSHKSWETTKAPSWVRPVMIQFLLGQPVKIPPADKSDYAPTVNRRKFEKHVKALLQAREVSVKYPLLWSHSQRKKLRRKHSSLTSTSTTTTTTPDEQAGKVDGQSVNTEQDRKTESPPSPSSFGSIIESYTAGRAATIAALHKSKSPKQLKKEAEDIVNLLADHLPSTSYDRLLSVFVNYVKADDMSDDAIAKKDCRRMRMLFTHLESCTTTHVHLVASPLGAFFYMDSPEDGSTSGSSTTKFNKMTDPRLQLAQKQWDATKADFVTSLEGVQPIVHADNAKREQVPSLKDQTVETLGELQHLRTRPSDGVQIGRNRNDESSMTGRPRKYVHLVFDAIALQDEMSPVHESGDNDATNNQMPATAPVCCEKIVFVDNLPIDVCENELMDLYSRCGPVQSIQIFNQREDLGPGPMTAKQLKAFKEQTGGTYRKRWQRPRTPLYCLVTFFSEEGAQNALNAELRMFGMVTRRHPMRSSRASDMTSLYLENIPPGLFSLDIEHKLSLLLHPEIYVCLDTGHHDYSEPNSCEIKFRSFELAYRAFLKLQTLDMEGCKVHWMKTPDDAMEYWTGHLGFD